MRWSYVRSSYDRTSCVRSPYASYVRTSGYLPSERDRATTEAHVARMRYTVEGRGFAGLRLELAARSLIVIIIATYFFGAVIQ